MTQLETISHTREILTWRQIVIESDQRGVRDQNDMTKRFKIAVIKKLQRTITTTPEKKTSKNV